MRNLNKVTIIGANGTMGSLCAGIIAAFGNTSVYMVARNIDKAKEGIVKACQSVRSDVIQSQMYARTYDDLELCVKDSDWIFELVAENYPAKESVHTQIARYRNSESIVTTATSGLSINHLAELYDTEGQKFFFGTHFYNPPYKLLLCEFVLSNYSDRNVGYQLEEYLRNVLLRQVVRTHDTPAFAGNRIGFQLLSKSTHLALQHKDRGGVAYIDALMGGCTGRTMPPLVTVDFVGLDVHKAIVDNLRKNTNDEQNESFSLPRYLEHLINLGRLGRKTETGLYKRLQNADGKWQKYVYDIDRDDYIPAPVFELDFVHEMNELISISDYRGAVAVMLISQEAGAEICRYLIANYISYSLSIVGDVVENVEASDMVMGFGFGWVPPSAYIDLIGGQDKTISFMKSNGVRVPDILQKNSANHQMYTLYDSLDPRSFFRAR